MLEFLQNLSTLADAGEIAFDVGEKIVKYIDDSHKEHLIQLRKSVDKLMRQKAYEEALLVLKQLIQKDPQQQEIYLYNSARCLSKLKRYDEALQNCEKVIQLSSDKKLLQKCYALKTQIKLGTGFWIQWLLTTVVLGIIGLFGTFAMIGDQMDQGSSFLWSVLATSVLTGFIQWLLIRIKTPVNIGYLVANIGSVLISFAASVMALIVNPWLGLLVFLGATVIFTVFSAGRLVKQMSITV
jgi:tetratricopeptide (TPR) repeat protein